MKLETIKKAVLTLGLCGIAFMSASAIAAPDEAQRQMTQRVMEAKQKLRQAEAASGAERQQLMEQHMKMMNETMGKMQAMKPKAGMSMPEQQEWINQHQKLMSDMMGQMMEEHHMMMRMGGMSPGAGNPDKK